MAAEDVNTVGVHILDREYRINCPENEREALTKSAQHLDDKMREIRSSGKVYGIERIAVMAALNITHEMLFSEGDSKTSAADKEQLGKLICKLDEALQTPRQMEL